MKFTRLVNLESILQKAAVKPSTLVLYEGAGLCAETRRDDLLSLDVLQYISAFADRYATGHMYYIIYDGRIYGWPSAGVAQGVINAAIQHSHMLTMCGKCGKPADSIAYRRQGDDNVVIAKHRSLTPCSYIESIPGAN